MATKINTLKQKYPPTSILLASTLQKEGISRDSIQDYVNSGWLVPLAKGIYRFSDGHPTLFSALSACQYQKGMNCHVGAATALELHGFTHFVTMGKPSAILFLARDCKLSKWLPETEWDMNLVQCTTSVLPDIGLIEIITGETRLQVSTPERAIMECLLLSPKQYGLMDIYYLMEMLTALRPSLVEGLLRGCTSVKVKRLFIYMADKARHAWFRRLNLEGIYMGTGPRSLEKGGVPIAKYKLIIPKELADYE
ncbi:MAG: type IV toxin-antitoxin system AbiEi family antitoxin [Bacteroidales bacterium]|nr:type IV toxin-antitoxin system AbiEi family antitoxin [Bacteroidales bacterium]